MCNFKSHLLLYVCLNLKLNNLNKIKTARPNILYNTFNFDLMLHFLYMKNKNQVLSIFKNSLMLSSNLYPHPQFSQNFLMA